MATALPVSLSSCAEPTRFSIPISLSLPSPVAVPVVSEAVILPVASSNVTGIVAGAAVERVVTAETDKRIVAGKALELVVLDRCP